MFNIMCLINNTSLFVDKYQIQNHDIFLHLSWSARKFKNLRPYFVNLPIDLGASNLEYPYCTIFDLKDFLKEVPSYFPPPFRRLLVKRQK